MKNKKWIAVLCCGAIILSLLRPGTNSQAKEKGSGMRAKSEKEYIIQTEDHKTLEKVARTYEDEIVAETQESTLLKDQNALVVDLTAQQARELDKKSGVSVERNITLSGQSAETPGVENVKHLAKTEWNKTAIKAKKVKKTATSKKTSIAILDSGADILSDVKFAYQISLIPEENSDDRTGHGTILSNLIASNENGFCKTGIIPEDASVSLYNVRILDANNQTPLSRAIEGIQWCIDNQMDIVNMSFGTEAESEILHEAIKKAEEAGILIVASVGNSGEKGKNITEYPAGYEEVVGVGSVNEQMKRSSFSNTGTSVELVAPGENIPVTSYWGLQGSGSGTSYATAQVTAIAALLWSENPDRNAREIRMLLDRSAIAMGDEEEYGHGLVNYEYASRHSELADISADTESANAGENAESANAGENVESAIQDYDVPISLKASWNTEGHTKLICSLANMSEGNVKAIKAASTYADTSKTLKHYDALHARKSTNYVSTAKCLYNAAKAWKGGTDYGVLYKEAERYCCTEENATTRSTNISQLKTAMRKAVVYNFQDTSKTNITANRGRLQLLGLAIHVAGDAYAHKTMCDGSKEGIAELEGIFYAAYNLSGVEVFIEKYENCKPKDIFEDIKSAVKSEKGLTTSALGEDFFRVKSKANVYFADSISFMEKRYSVATKVATSYLLKYYSSNQDFSPLVFCPYEIKAGSGYRSNYNYKLRHFKAFLTNAGYAPSSFTNGKNAYNANDIYALSFDR